MTKTRIDEMEIFAAVATAESFSEAARRQGLSPSAISRLVARLERRLEVRLVVRSTHGLTLTAEGSRYAEACRSILDSIEDAEAAVCGRQAALSGPLRISSSGPLAFHIMAPLVAGFRDRHPGIDLEFLVSDSLIDLIEERADVALRIGTLRDSALKLRRLGRVRMLHVAAPCYLETFGVPATREDLKHHSLLSFPLDRGRSSATARLGPATDSGEMLRHLALHGLGIARLAAFHAAGDLARGDLVQILEEEAETDVLDLSAVFQSHRQPAPRVTAFLDYLVLAAGDRLS
ncbi:MAG: LysR family transcriptional regulator [Kiloniellales bacterium]